MAPPKGLRQSPPTEEERKAWGRQIVRHYGKLDRQLKSHLGELGRRKRTRREEWGGEWDSERDEPALADASLGLVRIRSDREHCLIWADRAEAATAGERTSALREIRRIQAESAALVSSIVSGLPISRSAQGLARSLSPWETAESRATLLYEAIEATAPRPRGTLSSQADGNPREHSISGSPPPSRLSPPASAPSAEVLCARCSSVVDMGPVNEASPLGADAQLTSSSLYRDYELLDDTHPAFEELARGVSGWRSWGRRLVAVRYTTSVSGRSLDERYAASGYTPAYCEALAGRRGELLFYRWWTDPQLELLRVLDKPEPTWTEDEQRTVRVYRDRHRLHHRPVGATVIWDSGGEVPMRYTARCGRYSFFHRNREESEKEVAEWLKTR